MHKLPHGPYYNDLNFLYFTPFNGHRLLLHKSLTDAYNCPKMLSLICFKINSFNTKNYQQFFILIF